MKLHLKCEGIALKENGNIWGEVQQKEISFAATIPLLFSAANITRNDTTVWGR